MDLFETAGLKRHRRAAVSLLWERRWVRYPLPQKRDAWKNRNIEAQHKADRAGSRREGFRGKMPEREFEPMFRLYLHEKGVTQVRLFFAYSSPSAISSKPT